MLTEKEKEIITQELAKLISEIETNMSDDEYVFNATLGFAKALNHGDRTLRVVGINKDIVYHSYKVRHPNERVVRLWGERYGD